MRERLRALPGYAPVDGDALDRDPLRVRIDVSRTGRTGHEIAGRIRGRHDVLLQPDERHVTAVFATPIGLEDRATRLLFALATAGHPAH